MAFSQKLLNQFREFNSQRLFFHGHLKELFPLGIPEGSILQIKADQASTTLTFEFLKEAQLSNKVASLALTKNIGLAAGHELGLNLETLLLLPKAHPPYKELKLLITISDILAISQSSITQSLLYQLSKLAKFNQCTLIVFCSSSINKTPLIQQSFFDYQVSIIPIKWEGLEKEAGFLQRRLVKISVTKDRYNHKLTSGYFWLPDRNGKMSLAYSKE